MSQSNPFCTSVNDTRGRHANSSSVLRPGYIVSSTTAFTAQLNTSLLQKYCSLCFTSFDLASPNPQLKLRCTGGCPETFYCSKACQKLDFPTHKHECKNNRGVAALSDALSLLSSSDPSSFPADDYLLLRKTYFKLCKLSSVKPPNIPSFQSLEKLSFGATNEDDVLLALCTTTSVLGLDIARTSDLSSHPLTLFFTSLLAKFRCNNFGITSSLQSVVGAGVFEHGAILNHSCSPNCILHYEREAISDQVRQTIVVIRDVKEGEELCHSYCELAQPTSERQEHLKYTYGFDCRCPRCQDTDIEAKLSESNPSVPQQVKEELATYLALYDKLTMTEDADEVEENRLGSKVCLLMREVYGKLNLTLYKFESECLATSLLVGDLPKAIDHCTAVCSFLSNVMPRYHPLTVLQFVTLAELSSQGGMWEEAKIAYEVILEGCRVLYSITGFAFLDKCNEDYEIVKKNAALAIK